MPYGLKEIELAKLSKVFASNEHIKRVILYGSRAKGNYKLFSDVDITLEGPELTLTDLNHLSLAIDDLLLPYQFDISIFHTLKNHDLIDHIQRIGITIFERESEWKEYKLGELTIDGKGSYGIAAPAVDYDSNKYTYLRITDINDDGTLNKNGLKSVDDKNAHKYLLQQNDIVFARTGASVGRSYFYDERDGELVYAGFLIKYSIDPTKVNPKILKFYTHSQAYYDWIQTVDNGATRGNINAQTYASMPIILPERHEQDRIVSILSSLDDKIDLLHRENATLEQMAVTLYRQWFIVEAKEDWKEGKLGDIIDVKSGFAFKSSSFVDFGLYRLITIKAVQDGFLTLENADYISEIPDNIKDYCFLKEGDILLSLTGNVGRCCFVDRERLLLNQRVALLCAKDTKNWAFVYTLFRMQSMKIKLEEMAKGTAQPNLSPVELSNMQFEIPPTKLLEGFSETATPLLKKTLSNKKQIQTLIQTRDELLPRLMSNEIVL